MSDGLLAACEQWRDRVTLISRNLMDLSETESVKMVRARLKNGGRPFTGVTRDEAAKAAKLLDGLWEGYALLNDVIEQAHGLALKDGFFHDNSQRIQELLEAPSVVLPAEHIPIAKRGLLCSADKADRVTPAEMLGSMEARFAEARDAFLTVSAAVTSGTQRIAVLAVEAGELERWADRLGVRVALPELKGATEAADSDPLTLSSGLDGVAKELTGVRASLQRIEDERQAILSELEGAGGRVAELGEFTERNTSACAEAREKIAEAEVGVAPDGESAASLSSWLDALRANAASGRFPAVKVGLAKLNEALAATLSAQRSAYAINRALLDEREELKGRYKALCVKADALAARGRADAGNLAAVREQARQTLNTKPMDLKAARRLVAAYEAALVGAGR